MEPDDRDDARQAWESEYDQWCNSEYDQWCNSEYDQWCNEQVDADEINRLLNEAANVDE